MRTPGRSHWLIVITSAQKLWRFQSINPDSELVYCRQNSGLDLLAQALCGLILRKVKRRMLNKTKSQLTVGILCLSINLPAHSSSLFQEGHEGLVLQSQESWLSLIARSQPPPYPWLEVFCSTWSAGASSLGFFTILKYIKQTSGHLLGVLVQAHNVEISHLIRSICLGFMWKEGAISLRLCFSITSSSWKFPFLMYFFM